MSWVDLLFAHWRLDTATVRSTLPPGLELDTFQGAAWLGVVPFRMENVGPRGMPWLPWVSQFAELNVRTYVRGPDGKPGVWFYSLDAANPLAVAGARIGFHLPYFDARMTCERDGDWVVYDSKRVHTGFPAGEFRGRYRSDGEPYLAARGTLEHWLTERYCLYAADAKQRLFRGEIQHAPWPLRKARAEIEHNSVAEAHGFSLPGPPELLHFVDQLDVVGWTLESV